MEESGKRDAEMDVGLKMLNPPLNLEWKFIN